jgi:ABC-type transport system involved in multi-copper enzyme maturation permease subunit
VSETATVTRLAVRELWISFRLLALLAAYVAAGAVVALLPAPVSVTLGRLSLGLGAAIIIGSAIAAGALSTERSLGRAGWLVTRSISRSTLVVGWFIALGATSVVGLAAAGTLGWLAVSGPLSPIDSAAFAAVLIGAGAMGLAGIAIGLALGAVLRPLLAMLAALVLGAGTVAAFHLLVSGFALPVTVLGDLAAADRPVADGIRGAGACLMATAVALVLARLGLGRMDL